MYTVRDVQSETERLIQLEKHNKDINEKKSHINYFYFHLRVEKSEFIRKKRGISQTSIILNDLKMIIGA